MDRPPLVVVGAGGNATDALDTLEAGHEVLAFLDDNPALHGKTLHGRPVLPIGALVRFQQAKVICLIGSEKSFHQRAGIIARLGLPQERFATVIHPSAIVSRMATIGCGTVLFPGVQVISNAVIGCHVMVLPQTVVHHDSRIGDHSIVGARVVVAGRVTLGECCYVGSGSTLKNDVTVGPGALVGMAANVLRDVPSASVVVGNPARVLRLLEAAGREGPNRESLATP